MCTFSGIITSVTATNAGASRAFSSRRGVLSMAGQYYINISPKVGRHRAQWHSIDRWKIYRAGRPTHGLSK